MQLKQEELKTTIMMWPNQGSGVTSYEALGLLLKFWKFYAFCSCC